MKTTALFGAIAAAAVVVAGCGSWAHAQAASSTTCATSGQCDVTITVKGDGNTCSVDPVGDIVVKPGHKPDITWTITNTGTAQYSFRAGGIQFNDKADPVPVDEFVDKGVQGGGSGYRMKDQHKVSGKRFSYKITMNAASGTPCVVDPIVANE